MQPFAVPTNLSFRSLSLKPLHLQEAEVPWKKARKYLRWTGILMNKLTDFTGSTWTVFLVLALCVAWAIWGIFKRGSSDWQIVMQNFSSIQTYLWDLTLLNAQRCDYAELDRMFQDLIVRSLQTFDPECCLIASGACLGKCACILYALTEKFVRAGSSHCREALINA